ncbi:hypothetical protein SEUCBS139899_002192 [Sporothrix eucalyptigena]|uniref:Chromosome condensation protein n=1 Tax=Sporothrix eucalyptigena TaxID=1812306 RepID=A0ABP0B4V0_9PEZI
MLRHSSSASRPQPGRAGSGQPSTTTMSPQRTRSSRTRSHKSVPPEEFELDQDDDAAAPYDIPRTFSNLNEIDGPPPAENPDELPIAPHHSLEEYRSRDSRQPEERRSQSTAAAERTQFISRLRTELYTTAYLIFFSLMGTLARLGLISLTTYTGAPVSFGILWANFAGTAVLGFLAELSPIINRNHEAAQKAAQAAEAGNVDIEDEPEKNDDAEADPSSRDSAQVARADEEIAENRGSGVEGDGRMDDEGGVGGAPLDAANSLAPVDDEPTPDPIVHRRPIPLYVGLATGFCGSFTSFSSFMMDVFDALANTLPAPKYHPSDAAFSSSDLASRHNGYSVMAVLAVIFLTVCMCLSALKCGAHLAIALHKTVKHTPPLARHRGRRVPRVLVFADNGVVVLAFLCWLLAVLLTVFQPGAADTHQWRGEVLFALVFAPLGCLLRFYISLKLNSVFATFPLGTFTVNILGTAVLGMAWDLQHAPFAATQALVGCQVLQGVMDGFCGCLTTVSTWMTELSGLRRRHAYVYGLVSMATGLSVLVLIMGTLKWTVGFQEPSCS